MSVYSAAKILLKYGIVDCCGATRHTGYAEQEAQLLLGSWPTVLPQS